jgi:hypothetical protein
LKHQKQRNIKFAFLGLIIIGAIAFFYNESQTGFTNAGSFNIPLPDDFTGDTGSNINPDIECRLKSTGHAIDSRGVTLDSFDSSLLKGNPLLPFDLTDSNNNSMAGYVIDMKIFCDNKSGATLIVPSDSLSLILHSNDYNGSPILTASKTFSTKQLTFNQGGSEQKLGFVSVYASDIEPKLNTSVPEFNSSQKFQIVGNLKVYWQGYAGIQYKIPITPNQVVSYHTAKIINDDSILNPELADPDNDGIINLHDDCPDVRENFNGFEDSDGCPDTVPDGNGGTDDPTPEEPTTKDSCLADTQTWFETEEICSSQKFTKDTDNKSVYCKVWNTSDGKCTNPVIDSSTENECQRSDGTSCEVELSSDDRLIGQMLWHVQVTKTDGQNFAFETSEDDSPFKFEIPLNSLIGGKTSGEGSVISKIVAKGMIKINDVGQHALTKIVTSDVEYIVQVKVDDTWKEVKRANADGFHSRNGASNLAGMSVGSIEIRSAEIENKILETIGSTFTGSKDIELKIIALGDVGLEYNSETIQELELTIVNAKSNFDRDGDGVGDGVIEERDSDFRWTNLTFSIGGDCADVNNNGICDTSEVDDKPTCKSDEDLKASSVNPYTSKVEYVCVPKGTSSSENLTNQCTLGDTSVGCDICTDDGAGVGGFPCTLDYRSEFCNDTTQCGKVGTDGSTIIDTVESSDTKSKKTECIADGNKWSAPDFVPFGINDFVCLDSGLSSGGNNDGTGASGGSDITCLDDGSCTTSSSPIDQNMILYAGVGLGVIGAMIFILKRKQS